MFHDFQLITVIRNLIEVSLIICWPFFSTDFYKKKTKKLKKKTNEQISTDTFNEHENYM